MQVVLKDYWDSIVEYYYNNIQPVRPDTSIFVWLKEDFNCHRHMRYGLEFVDSEDFLAFRLILAKNSTV